MKKYSVIFVAVLLILQLLCCPGVMAETTTTLEQNEGDTTTTADPTDTTETTAETTEATETTTSTAEETDATTAQQVDTVTTTTASDVSITTLSTKLIIMDYNGRLAAKVTDVYGRSVEGIAVVLQIGTTKMPGIVTDANGYATFGCAFPDNDTYIYCYTESTLIGNTLYEGAAAAVGTAPTNTTADTTAATAAGQTTFAGSTTYRTYRTTAGTTQTTEALTKYTATATTGMEETYITLGFAFDSGVLELFDTDEKTFASSALLLLTPENYSQMLGNASGVLTMSAAGSATTVTDEQITAAVADDAVLSTVSADTVERVVLDLSMQVSDPATGDVTDVWSIATGEYVMQLPIPASMKSAQSIAVAAVTADGVSAPVYAHISKDGYFRFETTSPVGTIVILGFKGSMLGALTGHAVRSSIIFLVIGILCIGGAIFLYIRFVRRPKKAKQDAVEETAQPETEAPADEEYAPMEPEIGLDIFDDSEPAPLQRKEDPDIDIPL